MQDMIRSVVSDKLNWKMRVLGVTLKALGNEAHPVSRLCPICHYSGLFWPGGWPVRPEANCPRCGSAERHRLFKLWFDKNTRLFSSKAILHFAPERSLSPILRACTANYVTADFVSGADLKLNIEEMRLPNESFDVIVCSHVLEHVNDAAALREIHRVLRKEGLALIMIPICEGLQKTYENPSITVDHNRAAHFGQSDHLRWFGADFRTRVSNAHLSLDEFTVEGNVAVEYGLYLGERLFIAKKL
jgi:SAM-dependent methyltransferase